MPAIGDLFKGSAALTTGVATDIRPASGEIARIHYIIHSGTAAIRYYDSVNSREVEIGTYPANSVFGQALPVDNTFYLRVYGNTGVNVAWMGVYTKV